MSLDIVLVRHGLAESGQDLVADEDRRLLPEGIAALEQSFPATFGLLPTYKHAQLWVSSAERTRQTAAIIQKVCGIDEIVYSRLLMHQDIDKFLRALSESDLDAVISVGHIPMQERLCEHLSGNRLRFEPGAVACIRIPNEARRFITRATRPVGELRWFVQGPKPDVMPRA